MNYVEGLPCRPLCGMSVKVYKTALFLHWNQKIKLTKSIEMVINTEDLALFIFISLIPQNLNHIMLMAQSPLRKKYVEQTQCSLNSDNKEQYHCIHLPRRQIFNLLEMIIHKFIYKHFQILFFFTFYKSKTVISRKISILLVMVLKYQYL